jgi:RNA polymerase sigma-70 factor (ECF subfamily)
MTPVQSPVMDQGQTTIAVQRYLDELAGLEGDAPAEPVVRTLLSRSVDRLHMLCASLLHRRYQRLTKGPLNLQSEELLSAVVERMIKAMREVRPQNVRQFFALANQHMRWELNDMARRLDEQARSLELNEATVPAAVQPSESNECPNMQRILDAIDNLPEEEREIFHLVRLQGVTQPEAARITGVSVRTVHRRMNRGLMMLSESLGDLVLGPASESSSQSASE